MYEIPDGHVGVLSNSDFGAKYADIGGGFRDHVIAWNGRPVAEAINATPHYWSETKPSTAEGILLQKSRFLTRAPVGTQATVVLASAARAPSLTVNLSAYNDSYDTLTKTTTFLGKQVVDVGSADPCDDVKPQLCDDALVTTRTLRGGYSYIAIYGESYPVYQPFMTMMLGAMANNTKGIVIDLRHNRGGTTTSRPVLPVGL